MTKDRRVILQFAAIGFTVAAAIVLYSVLTDSSPPPPPNIPLVVAIMILCPPSLLGIACMDCEIGAGGFYFVWFFVGVFSFVLYGIVGAAYLRWRRRPSGIAAS
jgi:hypothetical protein